jgi:hypothetical protein
MMLVVLQRHPDARAADRDYDGNFIQFRVQGVTLLGNWVCTCSR